MAKGGGSPLRLEELAQQLISRAKALQEGSARRLCNKALQEAASDR
jgi:hypothetical protein